MTIDLIRAKDIIIGIAALITATKVIWDIAKKPTQRINIVEESCENLVNRVEKLEENSDKLELVLEKVNNLIMIVRNQADITNTSIEERELLIKSNKVVIKAVSSLLDESTKGKQLKNELSKAEDELNDFIISEAHKPVDDINNIK